MHETETEFETETGGRPTRGKRILHASSATCPGRICSVVLFASWELPQSVLGALVLAAVLLGGSALEVSRRYGRVCVRTGRLGVSLGAFVFWFRGSGRDPEEVLRHEIGHTVQSRLLGPLYLPVVGLPSMARVGYAMLHRRRYGTRWRNYRKGFPENWADRLAPRRSGHRRWDHR